jgi:GT2 family glycosyltransferase
MLFSFVTLSKDHDKVESLKQSIIDSIGSPSERTLKISGKDIPFNWNFYQADGSALDLFQGYNIGAKAAGGDYLCFLHDDVQLRCNHRAFEKPIELMNKPFTGIVGVAGASALPNDAKWWGASQEDCRGLVYHPSPETNFRTHGNGWPWQCAQFGRAVVCDGVFLMCSRKTFEKLNGFDHLTFQGFHLYDIDISTRSHLAGLQNYICPLPLFHASPGRPNEEWERNRKIFVMKYGKHLPLRV